MNCNRPFPVHGSRLPQRFLVRRRMLTCMAGMIAMPRCIAAAADKGQPVDDGLRRADLAQADAPFTEVVPGRMLRFPQDEGSHPNFRIEWWYVTGWLGAGATALGFQITFFRLRRRLEDDNPSAFVPRQLYAAHAALSDPRTGRVAFAERAARAAFGLAGAKQGRTHVWIDDWSLVQDGERYLAHAGTRAFSLDLTLRRTETALLNGASGYSRKSPAPAAASYYYSLPHLAVRGVLKREGRRQEVTGTAWLDHEWSSQYLDARAAGWDWIGINLANGGAIMAFRMRDKQDGDLWAGGSWRMPDGKVRTFAPDEVRFTPRRHWRSPRTGASYPVALEVRAGVLALTIEPLMDNQEIDARASTGTVYWEGAVRAYAGGRPAGRGYLELTGYRVASPGRSRGPR